MRSALLVLPLVLQATETSAFNWTPLPPLVDAEGFAGMYAGVSGDALVAAGGTQFSNGVPWWNGGTKIWTDAIEYLDRRAGRWVIAGKLPRALGDGVSVTYRDQVICIGGGDEKKAYSDVFALQLNDGRVSVVPFPPLPVPMIKMGGALVGDVVYVVGGRDDPLSPRASRTLFALDLSMSADRRKWVALSDCPGPGRMIPIVAAARGALYVFGGIEIKTDDKGRPQNVAPYLRDAYRYAPHGDMAGRWEKLADLPQPLAASPSPAFVGPQDTLTIFGGVDGAIEAITDRGSIRSLPGQILTYHIADNRWTRDGEMPAAEVRVNAPTVPWQGGWVIVGGERLPARRTPACTLVTTPARR